MTTTAFARILFLALEDPDEQLAAFARETKAAVERNDVDAGIAGCRSMTARMEQLEIEDPNGMRWSRSR